MLTLAIYVTENIFLKNSMISLIFNTSELIYKAETNSQA